MLKVWQPDAPADVQRRGGGGWGALTGKNRLHNGVMERGCLPPHNPPTHLKRNKGSNFLFHVGRPGPRKPIHNQTKTKAPGGQTGGMMGCWRRKKSSAEEERKHK